MIPERLVFIDLETTGTSILNDRITEVGFCEVHDGAVVEEWSSLINPGRPISPFIEQITGITTEMVSEAPRFSEIAAELQGKLAGKVLVAHNARFDYGFLKNEFRLLEITFQEMILCTLKLSRALFPEQKKHNLDELIQRHDLKVQNRHRALGDAQVIRDFFAKLCFEQPLELMAKAIRSQLKQPSLPPHLSLEQLKRLPSSPGVYLFYGENETVLYIGKSVDIRSRVYSHFAGDHRSQKGMRLSQQVRRIDHEKTAGEFGALLLEARLVKELMPIHNRQLRRTRDLHSIRLTKGVKIGSKPEIVLLKDLGGDLLEGLFGLFRTRRQAETALREIILAHGLCNRTLGLEKGNGACFNFQIKKCRGACVGQEPVSLHESRLVTAFASMKVRSWPYAGAIGIREKSATDDRTEIHVFNHWCHLGTADSEDQLRDILESPSLLPFDLDGYKILIRFLETKVQQPDLIHLLHPSRADRLV
ncbi:MAG: exonuclease domain-containing protein [Desulfuromonadales bacterium]|nr:exonuclease domain-containing protein [Desulfuromonadales bacterium]